MNANEEVSYWLDIETVNGELVERMGGQYQKLNIGLMTNNPPGV